MVDGGHIFLEGVGRSVLLWVTDMQVWFKEGCSVGSVCCCGLHEGGYGVRKGMMFRRVKYCGG